MDRNVYSLVLIDEVVEAVDKMAYEKNTSRSNLINQILAEYFSCPTPEMRMRDIFESVDRLMAGLGSFQIQFQPSDTMISIRSALRYRYKPTIRYTLELYRLCGPTLGELRVSARTQSQSLLSILTDFFVFWSALENKYIASYFPEGKVLCEVETGRYTRQFLLPRDESQQTNENLAAAISDYIRSFDKNLKLYFSGLDDLEAAEKAIEENYSRYVKISEVI